VTAHSLSPSFPFISVADVGADLRCPTSVVEKRPMEHAAGFGQRCTAMLRYRVASWAMIGMETGWMAWMGSSCGGCGKEKGRERAEDREKGVCLQCMRSQSKCVTGRWTGLKVEG
jgi:hypothetical protein